MALATQCPHCHTTFRVAHDQLKLRAGMVRCGACKQVFNGVEHLLRPDDAAAAPTVATAPTVPTVATAPTFTEVTAPHALELPAGSTAGTAPAQPAAEASMPTAAEVTAAVTAELTAQPTSEVTEEVTPSSAARSGQEDGSAEPTEPLDFGIFLDPVNTGAAQRYEAPSAPAPEAMEAPRDPALAEARQPHPIDHPRDALTRSVAPPTAATRRRPVVSIA